LQAINGQCGNAVTIAEKPGLHQACQAPATKEDNNVDWKLRLRRGGL
jgi:hypothetical protein